jgi:hypothetical protein
MQPYTRPIVPVDVQLDAAQLAARLINGKSTADIRTAIAGMLCENYRLTLEVNEHRKSLGFEPLPTVEQK